MKIKVNQINEIVGYVDVGDIPDSIEYSGAVPDDFEANFKPSFYMLQGDEIIVNPNYEEPTVSIPEDPEPSEPSKEWQAINMLALQVAQLKAEKGSA